MASQDEYNRSSVSFTDENWAWLNANVANRSEFINELVRNYRQGASSIDAAVARYRVEQIQQELQQIEHRRESLKDELERHRQARDAATTAYDDAIGELLSKLEAGVRIWPDHKMVCEVANEHNKRPEQVVGDLRNAAHQSGIQTETLEQ